MPLANTKEFAMKTIALEEHILPADLAVRVFSGNYLSDWEKLHRLGVGCQSQYQFRGLFKAPSLRNADKRPYANFVRAYMHNGVFKSLEDVVHFYNKRNIAVDAKGNEVAFDLRNGPPAGTTRLIAPPEVLDNVQNVAGLTPDDAAAQGVAGDTPTNGQVGNLGLSDSEEEDLVNFLKILTDGFTSPHPVR
jgi:cytochrome c peroxidase